MPVECVELEEEDDEDDELDGDELAADELDDELELELVAEAGAHDSLSETIGSDTGRLMLDSGVPGGTLTVKDWCAPPATVTVITHSSADAAGSDPSASTVLTAATAPTSFAPLSTLDYLLPPRSCANSFAPRRNGAAPARYCLAARFSTPNRRGV